MAIGDEKMTVAMLEAVGSPVAMENGREELKKIINTSQVEQKNPA